MTAALDLRSMRFGKLLAIEPAESVSGIKAEPLAALGDAPAGRLADGRIITAKRINRGAYSVEASSYVDLRVKGKAA